MKKILALLLALSMLFALTACGGDDKNTHTGESTGETTSTTESTNDATDGTEDSTQGTTEGATGTETTEPPTTTPPTTTPPTTTPPATDAPHTHSYSSKVTTAATCTAKGVKTYTCSCGNSYTEDIKATGHKWGEWKQTTAPSYTAKGEETRTCGNCSATEKRDVAQLSLESKFKYYPNIVSGLGFFNSTNDLTAYTVFTWWMDNESVQPSKTESFWDTENYIDVIKHTYPVSSLNEYTNKYFGRTWDYSTIVKSNEYDEAQYSYDAATQSVIVTYLGASGGPSSGGGASNTYKGYTAIDNTHFEITYSTNYMGQSINVIIKVELKGDKFIITSHTKA